MKVKFLQGVVETITSLENVISVYPTENAEKAVIEYKQSNNVITSRTIESKKILSITIEEGDK
jgi:hypothetical protein